MYGFVLWNGKKIAANEIEKEDVIFRLKNLSKCTTLPSQEVGRYVLFKYISIEQKIKARCPKLLNWNRIRRHAALPKMIYFVHLSSNKTSKETYDIM
jgi:hypothetical protein